MATVSVFDLNFAGTCAAIVLSVAGVEIVVEVVLALVVVVAAFLLLPPQPAARTATRARTASPAADGVFKRCMLGPFVCGSWAGSLVSLRLESYLGFSQVRLPHVLIGAQALRVVGERDPPGLQHIAAIGRALMARPKLLMLDEPSMGLAPIFVERIFEIVVEINKQGTPILLVEQNALMALDVAHRGYVLETGSVALADEAKALRENEQVRKTYLGEE